MMKTTSFQSSAPGTDRSDLFSSSGTASPLFLLADTDINTHIRQPLSDSGYTADTPARAADLDWLIEVVVMGVTVLLAYSFF